MTKEHKTEAVTIPLSFDRPPEPLVEEINVVKLEGHYFCFDPREAKRRTEPLEFTEGNRKITILPHPAFGQPSVLAYRILQAIFRKITLEGKPFPETVSFTARELARFVGRTSWGSQTGRDLEEAIMQLKTALITIQQLGHNGKAAREMRFSFNLLSQVATIADQGTKAIEAVVLRLDNFVIESMRRNHFIILNWNLITELPPLSAAIYKRLYLHLSNIFEERTDKRTLKFEKDYEDICRDWLGGLKVWKYKSDIERQLQEHIRALVSAGFLSSFGVEKRLSGEGYKLTFRPGTNFFRDYERFYKNRNARVLQFQQAADTAQFHEPVELTRHFFKILMGVEKFDADNLSSSDIAFARDVLTRYQFTEACAFIDYALSEARRTKFDIQTIHGLKLYFLPWEANKERRELAAKNEAVRKATEDKNRLQNLYEELVKKHTIDTIALLPKDEYEVLKGRAEFEVEKRSGRGTTFNLGVSIVMRRMVLETSPFPKYEDWLHSQG